ncbi:Signal transduction histidine-protein kinase ArlS [bioreactor metagenome]|uniref:histidine kinase n=1 Tax=bioreactor metagenome TaxID=1076179 RepID=A0A645DXN6_9ZZZZ
MEQDLLASLLLNLIDNAGKASRPGSTIELLARGNVISVADHGQGMPKEELGKITQPFYMIDRSRAKKAGGIGLGLALAAEIARLHSARLEFESECGVGTTAKVVFDDVA